MADINFVLDTDPLAQKVDDVAVGVGAVGAAVTAMQAAGNMCASVTSSMHQS